jgi:hypothetical protein
MFFPMLGVAVGALDDGATGAMSGTGPRGAAHLSVAVRDTLTTLSNGKRNMERDGQCTNPKVISHSWQDAGIPS